MSDNPARTGTRRVLLKLSGESFCQPGGHGIDPAELGGIAGEIESARQSGAQIAVVVGGGNMIRGGELAREGATDQATADQMGMLGTVINGLALREKLTEIGVESRCLTAIGIPSVAEAFIRLRALRHLEKGRVVVLAGGTGNPFFTTDSAAALRAIELNCDVILKATKVDGVYSADPRTDPKATRFEQLTYAEAIEKQLRVMDQTALAMCREHGMPIVVFDFKRPGNIRRAVEAEKGVGTRIAG